MVKSVETTLPKVKTCKSCVRFNADSDKVTACLYLMNESYKALGSPETIKVTVSVPEVKAKKKS